MKKILIAALLTSLSASVFAAQTIRFGAEASYPPFEFVGSDNKIQGFDVDLAMAICKQINANCSFTNQSFDSLIASLKFRRIDAAMSGMDITPERQKQVLFSTPYYLNSARFVTEKGKVTELAALKGKKVGVQNGTTHQKYLADKLSDIKAVPYDSYQNAILDLKNGRLDAVFGDTAVINESLKTNSSLTPVGETVTDKDYFSTGIAIAVRQGNSALQQQFNQALAKVKADGEYQKIYDKWFQK